MDSKKVINDTPTRKKGDSVPVAGSDASKWVETSYTWDSNYRKPSVVSIATSDSSKASSTTTEYNTFGLPDKVTVSGLAAGVNTSRVTTIGYSTDGYFAETVTKPLGHSVVTSVDPKHGQPLSVKDVTGVTTTTDYDALARPKSVTKQGTTTQYISYLQPDAFAPALAVSMVETEQSGAPTSASYQDALGRTIKTRTEGFAGEHINQLTEYNARGLKRKVSNLYTSTASYTEFSDYDVFGRVTQKVTPQTMGNLSTTYTYTGLETKINVNADYGVDLEMYRTYNTLNQLVDTVDANGKHTEYAYDGQGNSIVIRDAKGNQITASYNALGRKNWVNDPNQGYTEFTYNDFGELEKEEHKQNNAVTNTISYVVDALGRVKSRNSSGSTATFNWDTEVKGLLSDEKENGIEKAYSYGAYARLDSETVKLDGQTYVTGYSYYDQTGLMKSMTYPNQLVVGFDYNSYGYLAREYNAASGYNYRTVSEQDAFGQIKAALLGDSAANVNQSFTYSDVTGQMYSSKASTGQGTIHHISYDNFDSYGNLLAQSNLANGFNADESYTYDSLHRLKTSTVNAGGISSAITYRYDEVGNLLSKSDYSLDQSGAYSYNTGTNQVASVQLKVGGTDTFEYDERGNLTHRNGVEEAIYNAFNKPTSITRLGTSTSFVYGADLMRYKQTRTTNGKTVTTHYVGKHYEVEKEEFGEQHQREKIYISDVAIITDGTETNAKKIRFTLRDRLGSATTLVDHNGYGISYRFFDPFGKPRGGDWAPLSSLGLAPTLANNALDADFDSVSRRGFTDHEHLDEVQLIHMNGRVYDYNLGRFLSVDPFIQSPANSQSLNPYSYIMNNPLSGADPTGYIGNSETVDVTEDTQGYEDKDGNKYVTAGDGSGDLIKVESVTVTKSNGSSSTASYGAGGNITGGSVTSGGVTSGYTEIGSQEHIAKNNGNPNPDLAPNEGLNSFDGSETACASGSECSPQNNSVESVASLRIGYYKIGETHSHAFIIVLGPNGQSFVIRGGPEGSPDSLSGQLSGLTGGSTESNGTVGFGNLLITNEIWAPGNYEYDSYQDRGSGMRIISFTSSKYGGNPQAFFNNTVRRLINYGMDVNRANIPYRPTSTNSNAFAHQAIQQLGYARPSSATLAPGSSTVLEVK